MVYIVQAARTGDDDFSLTVDDREEALATAVARGRASKDQHKVIVEGRVYSPKQLALVIIETKPAMTPGGLYC